MVTAAPSYFTISVAALHMHGFVDSLIHQPFDFNSILARYLSCFLAIGRVYKSDRLRRNKKKKEVKSCGKDARKEKAGKTRGWRSNIQFRCCSLVVYQLFHVAPRNNFSCFSVNKSFSRTSNPNFSWQNLMKRLYLSFVILILLHA